jgi:catechol-2,3-dioxygenase
VIDAAWIDHIHLHVGDVERAARFYCDVFGARETFRVGAELIFLALPNGGVVALDGRPQNARNLQHVGMELGAPARLDDAVREVQGSGGSLVERGEHAPGIEYVYVADPDGNVFELHASR